jgi:hypothetical protein
MEDTTPAEVTADTRGRTVHEGISEEEGARFEKDVAIDKPARILEHRSRETVINALEDHFGMLDYWGHAGLPIRTEFSIHDGKRQIEYWDTVVIQPIEDRAEGDIPEILEKA